MEAKFWFLFRRIPEVYFWSDSKFSKMYFLTNKLQLALLFFELLHSLAFIHKPKLSLLHLFAPSCTTRCYFLKNVSNAGLPRGTFLGTGTIEKERKAQYQVGF